MWGGEEGSELGKMWETPKKNEKDSIFFNFWTAKRGNIRGN